MTDPKLLLRPAEAAELLSLSRAKLYQLLSRGDIGSVKIATSRRIPLTEIEAYIERLRTDGQTNVGAESVTPARRPT